MQHLILIWQHGWPGLGHWSECPVCHSKVSCFVFLFWCLLCAHMSLWRTDFSYDMFLCKDCLLVFFWYHFPFRVPNPPKPPKGGVNHMLAKFWNWYFFKAANLIESGSQSCLWVVKYYLYPNLYVYLCRKVNILCYKTQSRFVRLWLVASVCSYSGLQGARNRDYCAVATEGVSKWNPCWPGWRPAGGRGQCVWVTVCKTVRPMLSDRCMQWRI